ISSLIIPTKGEVRFNQVDVLKDPQVLREKHGVVPQELALYDDLTARENLEFFGQIQKIKKQDLKKKIDEVLDQIGLDDQGKKLLEHFSGDMRWDLDIGAGILHETEILIMDVQTVAIDPQSINYILETVKRLDQEKHMTILYTS